MYLHRLDRGYYWPGQACYGVACEQAGLFQCNAYVVEFICS